MNNRLLATKFHFPPWFDGSVARPRLVQHLNAGMSNSRKLTLVSAPAGYGKTTLVSEWIHSLDQDLRVAWLSLDELDNDPARFLDYWISSLHQADETLGQSAVSLLGVPQLPSSTIILDQLLNDLAALENRICLVLDDYHVISSSQIHEAVEYFLDHQPVQVHLIITTRVDPPLPLARMRTRGQMTEIRASDLRFTLEESSQYFNQSRCLDLPAEAVQTLESRTEGWAAGLQLAALALQNQPDRQDFLADFGGSHRYVIDYLLDEVLKLQPPEISDFLAKTSILSRFNAELCQAVTGNPTSADILAQLERCNLFLIPLDNTRGWYRYHHLFADALRVGLERATERALRSKAAAWLEDQGLFTEAIPHWLAAPEPEQAAHLIARLAPDLLRNGEMQTLIGWLNVLPETVVDQSPDLISHKAFCLLMTGQTKAARDFASRAFLSLPVQSQNPGYGRLLAMQAWFAAWSGETNAAELARAALERLAAADLFFRTLALLALGSHYALIANLSDSSQVFRETWELGRQMNHPFIAMGALANLTFNLLEMGKLRESEALCRAALSEYVDNRGRQLPILGILYAPLAAICYEKGDFTEAQVLAERGIAICKRLFSNEIMGGDNEITLARIAFENGDPKKAFELLHNVSQSANQRGMTVVVYKMAIVQADFYLLQGNLIDAERKLRELEVVTNSDFSKTSHMIALLRARFLAASNQAGQALEILNHLEEATTTEGALRRWIAVRLAQSLTYQRQGDHARAWSVFESVLRQTASEGFRSLFFPHPGRPTRPLLEAARATAPAFVDEILKDHPASPLGALPDPLSEQELRVLNLIVAGKSNQEIAAELVISVGTAKWHVHNILQKLGVNNRPQAIARARELELKA